MDILLDPRQDPILQAMFGETGVFIKGPGIFIKGQHHLKAVFNLGPWALERSDLTQSGGSGGGSPPVA